MASTAFQTAYRDQFIQGFEARTSFLRAAVTSDGVVKGGSYVFNVIDSGSATAQTRGVNGLLQARHDNNTQSTATLAEWADLVRKTGFNVFASQGNQIDAMQRTTMAVLNRKIDLDIIAQLDASTHATASVAAPATLAMVASAIGILGKNFVPIDEVENMFAVVTPAFWGYLMQIKEFANGDYVDVKPLGGGISKPYRRWMDINWIRSPLLTGMGTSSEKCYMFHRSAVGHGYDSATLQSPVGYDEEQDYSWARCSGYFGSKLLQNSGVIQMLHDGSAFVGT